LTGFPFNPGLKSGTKSAANVSGSGLIVQTKYLHMLSQFKKAVRLSLSKPVFFFFNPFDIRRGGDNLFI
jgi:hypothetical protein